MGKQKRTQAQNPGSGVFKDALNQILELFRKLPGFQGNTGVAGHTNIIDADQYADDVRLQPVAVLRQSGNQTGQRQAIVPFVYDLHRFFTVFQCIGNQFYETVAQSFVFRRKPEAMGIGDAVTEKQYFFHSDYSFLQVKTCSLGNVIKKAAVIFIVAGEWREVKEKPDVA